MKKICSLLCLFSLMTFSSCDKVQDALNAIDKAIFSIDRGITAASHQSTKWRNIFDKLEKDLPAEVQQTITGDLKMLANDAIGSANSSVLCDIDFVKLRVTNSLRNLKLKIQGLPYTIPKPGFCTLETSGLDLNSDTKNIDFINIYGFDLNSPDTNHQLIQCVLIGDSSRKVISSDCIGRTTNYQMAINVNSLRPLLLNNDYSKIQFLWNNDTAAMPQILIKKWEAKLTTETAPEFHLNFFPPLTKPDGDFDTDNNNWTDGKVHVEFRLDDSKTSIEARVYMWAMEFGGDNTTAEGYSPWTKVFTLGNKDYTIESYSSQNQIAELPFSFRDQNVRAFFPGGPVAEYDIQIDHKGTDVGEVTNVTAYFSEFTVFEQQVKK